MKKFSLRGYIKKTLHEHSGGIKFTDLLAKVLFAYYEHEIIEMESIDPDSILLAAKKDFKILRYDQKIGEHTCREKIFVYYKES